MRGKWSVPAGGRPGPAIARICLLLMLCAGPAEGTASGGQHLWTEQTFGDFVDGAFDDGGVQLYVTAAGDIRFINQYDLDGNGAVDLVFCNTHDTAEKVDALIYWGSGGGFAADRATRIATDGAYYGLVEDLDADGWPDLVLMNRDNGTTTVLQSFVYWGSAAGYTPERRSEFTTYNPGRCVAADLNGDGLKDLVVPNGFYRLGTRRFDDVGVRIHWGTTDGYSDHDAESIGETDVSCVATGFLEARTPSADRPPDLFVGRRRGPSRIYLNRAGRLDREHPVEVDCGSVVQAIGVDPEDPRGESGWFINGGAGLPVRLLRGSASRPTVRDLGVTGGQSIAAADVDADGSVDLVVAGLSEQQCGIYWGTPEGYARDRATVFPIAYASDVCVADLNLDGRLDVVFARQMDEDTFDVDSVVLWGGEGREIGSRTTRLPGSGTMGVCAGDLNRDGCPDVVLVGRIGGRRTGRVPTYIYWNDGQGHFSAQRRTALITNDNYEAAAADFNLDGYPDLVFAEQYETQGEIGESHVFWGSAKGFRQDRSTGLMTHGAMGVSVADLNRDGYLDIVFGQLDRVPLSAESRRRLPQTYVELVFGEETPGPVRGRHMSRVYWGRPDGFSVNAMCELQTMGAGTPVIADFDRDGYLDLVFPNGADDTGAWLYHGGPGGFESSRARRFCFDRCNKAEAADVDGDGWLDLILACRVKGLSKDAHSFLYRGSPEGFSEKRRLEFPTRGAGSPSLADLNRDGRLDLFITNYASDFTRRLPSYLYWGQQVGFSSLRCTELPAESGSDNLIADFDGDGWLDIAVACHRKEGSRDVAGLPHTHVAESIVYFGGADGFDPRRSRTVPTVGPHGMYGVDAGHIYHRRLEWMYTSSVHELDRPRAVCGVSWEGHTPGQASIAIQIRCADSREAMDQAPWAGPDGPDSWFERPGQPTGSGRAVLRGRFAQYRVRFRSERGARYPALSRVEVDFQ